MKIIKLLMFSVLLFSVASITSCKKEKKIERNLWNKGGEWNIVKYHETSSFFGQSDDEIQYNVGTFKFEKEGSGKITITQDGKTNSNLFNYSNTENSLKLIYKEGPFYYEGDTETFTLDWEKNKIQLYYYEEDSNGYDEITIDLEKK